MRLNFIWIGGGFSPVCVRVRAIYIIFFFLDCVLFLWRPIRIHIIKNIFKITTTTNNNFHFNVLLVLLINMCFNFLSANYCQSNKQWAQREHIMRNEVWGVVKVSFVAENTDKGLFLYCYPKNCTFINIKYAFFV